jgi:ABC-2 type transport system permease protein
MSSFLKQFRQSKKAQGIFTVVLVAAILLIVNVLASFFNGHIDLTEEKRFTMTEPTKRQLKDLNDVVFVRVLLDGSFPASFKRLQGATREMLNDFHTLNPYIEYKFEDPSVTGSAEERKKRMEQLKQDGIVPTRLRVVNDKEKTEQYIFPFAEFNYRNRKVLVKLLEDEVPGLNREVTINNSVSLLEYKFSNAIQKLMRNDRPNIVFTEGHDELKKEETADLEQTLRAFYNTGRINLDSVTTIPFKDSASRVDVLVVAKPKTAFSEKHKFQLDQYVMQGGRVIWLIDRLNVDLAGMQQSGEMMPTDFPLNIEDLLYKYGIRIVNSMVVDMEAARIPMKVGQVGNQPQMELFQWFYYPIVTSESKHPIVRSLDRVWLQFPSSIDTIRTKSAVKKSIILTSSKHSRLQMTPTKLSFEILRYPTDPSKFDKANVPLAVMLEGQFTSLYENRVTPEQVAVLQQLGQQFTPLSRETKMLVVSDGDIARNEYDARQGQMLPLGYNRFENYKFANKDFLMNSIEYMMDDKGIIEARGKEVKLRLMDTQKAKDNKVMIQALNILLPLFFVGLFGFGFTWFRKRKYAY